MVQINASLVKELRDATNVGMMECKRALQEANGDKEAAIKLLRERGVAIAGKKASRTAKEGLVAAELMDDGKAAVMIEVNCETDFVARNENFQAFVADLLERAKGIGDNGLADAVKDELTAKIAEIGENMIVRRNVRYDVQGTGIVATYVHMGGKVGVLIEVGCGKEETLTKDAFKDLVKDLTLHIAAASPQYLKREEVPEETVAAERDIYAKQVEGKPANIIDKIVDGKLNKFYSQICLIEQPFVKENDLSITDLLKTKGKELDDTIEIRRYVRYQLGA
ncbi:MAG: translation elongation factor Ts [Spartobacteria bacterium]|nr:translation elongation factor Ts [Spartobacteria bacterium]